MYLESKTTYNLEWREYIIWHKASWIFTVNSDSWSLQPHSPPRGIIQRPNHHVVCLQSTPLHNIKLDAWENVRTCNWITKSSTLTCQVFKHAARHKVGLRAVYFHLRQTHAALPKVYGLILVKICWKKGLKQLSKAALHWSLASFHTEVMMGWGTWVKLELCLISLARRKKIHFTPPKFY